MTTFNRHDRRTARKPHQCDECSHVIQPGESYWNGAYKCEESNIVFDYKACDQCNDLHNWFRRMPHLEFDDVPSLGAGSLQWEVAETDYIAVNNCEQLVVDDPEGPIVIDADGQIRLAPWARMVLEIEDAINAKRYSESVPHRFGDKWLAGAVDRAVEFARSGCA
jgi:hypothetical protein